MLKKIISLLLFCCFGVPLFAAQVSGTIKNTAPGTTVALEVPHTYLNGQTALYKVPLDNQNRFVFDVEMVEPGLVFFVFNDDRLPVFLANDDTLHLKTDAFQFPVSVTFSGKNGGNNQFFQEYLRQNEMDFNEFNNIRFKIGQTWVVVEEPVNGNMENLAPDLFKSAMDAQRTTAQLQLDEFLQQQPGVLTDVFTSWFTTEITYNWAYHLLVYGQVYAGRYGIQPPFFDFLYEAPIVTEQLGSEWYRRFLLAFMARQQVKTGTNTPFWAGQYELAEKLLSGRSLAFFRSELIALAFSTEHFAEILPLYNHFLQKNPFKIFDDKIEGLYQKYARVFPGAAAPAFEGIDQSGAFISLDQYRGKVVYLNFWASWCGACLKKMEFFDEFETELTANNIAIVNISIDEQPAQWQEALKTRAFKGRHVLASSGTTRNIALTYDVQAVPQYFIIGKTGLFESKAPTSQPNDVRQTLLDISARGH